jgi:hypothetical protein
MSQFTATIEGQTFTRNTKAHAFTHAVVCRAPHPQFVAAHKGPEYKAHSWTGSLALAQAQVRRWSEIYTDVAIVEALPSC